MKFAKLQGLLSHGLLKGIEQDVADYILWLNILSPSQRRIHESSIEAWAWVLNGGNPDMAPGFSWSITCTCEMCDEWRDAARRLK